MRFSQSIGACLAALASLAVAGVVPAERVERRTTITSRTPDAACTNGPKSRDCWTRGYSIATDFDQKFPTTGGTVTYDLEITNSTCNPDGNGDRTCLLINGQYPGPLIRATWGDQVVINVKNSMQDNGTSIHWHGVRQYNSCGSDGVNGVVECPLAPGDSKQYAFQATQFGTSWYHSHHASQYGDGIMGPMIFDGPSSANWDIDLGPYFVSDWYYPTSFQIESLARQNLQAGAPPPSADTILINGTNKNANGGGEYNQATLQQGKKHRLRLINPSSDNYIRVSLDGHTMLVMSADFIPVKPFAVQTLLIGIGQRYDVVITANQTAGNYWFRANVARDCFSGNNGVGRAIWSYSDVEVDVPASTGWTEPTTCSEPSPLAPYWKQPVPSGTFQSSLQELDVNFTRAQIVPGGDAVVVWALGSSSMNIQWENPTLSYVMSGNTSYPDELAVLPTVNEGGWNYWLIQQLATMPPIPHPIHLHGHDFFVLGQGAGTYTSGATLNWATPPRRDTATVPGRGWLAIAFNSNNPGAWLMHCHIAWHVAEGLAVQFLEAPSQIVLPDQAEYDRICSNWNSFYQDSFWKKDDSGL